MPKRKKTQLPVTVPSGDTASAPRSSNKDQSKRAKGQAKNQKESVYKSPESCDKNTDGNGQSSSTSFGFAFETSSETFARLIHPMSTEDFFAQYWEKQPLVLTQSRQENSVFFETLFTREILEGIVATKKVCFVQDCNVCRYKAQKRESLNGKGAVKPSQLRDLLDKSRATVQFHQPQRFQESIWQLLEHLETFFGRLVGSNVYMTPSGSQGLAPHYDDVEVIILQLEGKKRWRLYEPPIELPRDYSRDLDQSEIGDPIMDVTLEAGDVMYFPRGTVHQAETPNTCSHSTHLTISTYQRASWADLIEPALPSIMQSAIMEMKTLRQGLPLRLCCDDQASSKQTIRKVQELLSQIGNHLEADHCQEAANEMLCDFIANRLPPFTSSDLSPNGPVPSVEHQVRLRFPGHSYVISREDEDDEDDEEEEEDEEGDGVSAKISVYHSLGNTHDDHMMASEPKTPQGIQIPLECEEALRRLHEPGRAWTSVKDLDLQDAVRSQMLTSLWAEGLLEVREIGTT